MLHTAYVWGSQWLALSQGEIFSLPGRATTVPVDATWICDTSICSTNLSRVTIQHKCQIPTLPPAPCPPAHISASCLPSSTTSLLFHVPKILVWVELSRCKPTVPGAYGCVGRPAHIHVPSCLLMPSCAILMLV